MAHGSSKSWHGGWLDIKWFVGYLAGWGVSRALSVSLISLALFTVLSLQVPDLLLFTFEWLVGTAPIWLPIALAIGAWYAWVAYAQALYLSKREVVLLEMRVPRDIEKSPRAMELALANFSLSSGEGTLFHRIWKGQVRPFFSLEIASFGGEIHFYIWTWRAYKDIVETSLYGAYPEIELIEVEDYASAFRFDPSTYDAQALEWPLKTLLPIDDPFRVNAYQPRSYIDFELEKDPKEEFKIDPFANVLEFMSGIKPDEQLWVQIVFRKAGKLSVLTGKPDEESMWKTMVENEVHRLRTESSLVPSKLQKKFLEEAGEDSDRQLFISSSWRQGEMIKSMERHLGKTPFQVGIRGIYWSKEGLRGSVGAGFRYLWRPFGNPNYGTQFNPSGWHSNFDYPWQDFHGWRWRNQTYRVLDAYRRRSFFYSPWKCNTNVLTNETIASIWHPPSRTIVAPGIARISATKVEPPGNLPK